jgi:hypothetical protein
MRSIPHLAAALAASLLTCVPAHALEPFALYDNFTVEPLSIARWNDPQRIRFIDKGALLLGQHNVGQATADSGSTVISYGESLSNPAAITALKAKITVTELEVYACAANPALGQSRARIVGAFFNIGSPVPGSQIGDAIAQVRLMRVSNSADPAGVLRVTGSVVACTNADCSTSTPLGSPAELGTVNIGTATTVQMQWDQPGKRFKFSRDLAAFSGNVAYTETDASPPSVAFKQLSTLMDVPNCQSGPRVNGLVMARFDNIFVNRAAAP